MSSPADMGETAGPPKAPSRLDEAEAQYRRLRRQVRQTVNRTVPTGAKVLVASSGDEDLLRLGLRDAWHFPQVEDGTYAGFVPADDAEAIAQLETLRKRGAEFLVFPAPALWWLEHYDGFREHLEFEYRRPWADEECVVFDLGSAPAADGSAHPRLPRKRASGEAQSGRSSDGAPTEGIVDIDISRTRLHERFFAAFPIDTLEEFGELVLRGPDLDSFSDLPGSEKLGYSGWAYWFFYLSGYLEYVESGVIGSGNTYYEFLRRYFVPRTRDRGLAGELGNPLTAIERMARRFRDLDYFHHPATHNPAGLYGPAPVKLIVGARPADNAVPICVWGSDAPLVVDRLDGHHRLFAARLLGGTEFRAEVVLAPRHLPPVLGAVEEFRFDGERLEIRGWCVHPLLQVESFEVQHGDVAIAEGGVDERPDVAERFPAVPHALRSGFAIEADCELPVDQPMRFNVVPRSDWLPVGAIAVPYLPGMFDAGMPARETLRALKVLDGMLAPLVRHRPLDAVESVLLCHSPLPIRKLLSRLLPNAEIVEEDAELVLAYSVLHARTSADQVEWLRQAHELLRPGGYLITSVRGELMRPFLAGSEVGRQLDIHGIAREGRLMYQTRAHTVEKCSQVFEVVEYVEGCVDDREDVVLLRKE